ncbi:carbohydrate porin [Sphingomonas bacterium]|uniref:carbohydrate porin n=1 Tax=Sphingomonas bacterium TaxID=1895847 RepID=UPI001577196E|nr:carbohydrate porin [Sphingomonas bacterium]
MPHVNARVGKYRRGSIAALSACAACIAVAASSAHAAPIPATGTVADGQDRSQATPGVTPDPTRSTTAPPSIQNPSAPTSPPPRSGLFPTAGADLLSHGIDVHGIAFDHYLANPSAGIVTGRSSNLGVLAPAIDVDLEKLAGLRGSNFHVQATFFGLQRDIPGIITQAGGFLTGFQTTPAPVPNVLSVLTFEQKLVGGRLSIEVGRSNIYRNFLLSNSLDVFTSFSSTLEVDGDFNSPPYPVWSARAAYRIDRAWYVQGGVFEDNYRHASANGNDFSTDGASGAAILAEVGYRTEFDTAARPGNFEVGVEVNTRHGYSNIKGTGADATPRNTAADYPGGGVLFAQGAKVVWRGTRRPYGPPANIAPYGSIDIALGSPQPIELDAIAGLNVTGFIPGRPFDALGLQAHYQRLSAIEASAESRAQVLTDGPGRLQPRGGLAFETVANIQVTKAFAVRPIAQYFVDPDAYYLPAQARPHDGFELSVFAVLSLGRLLGTSQKPF